MNKQDKIKKVMREFKDGKLKTPNGEVVTDKKQALAIAMSESEDYAEKADLIEDISIGSLSDAEDVIKGIGSEELFEKAVYADTAENRKLGRVGQEYHRGKGTKKEDKKTNKNSWGYEIKPEYSNHMSKIISKKFGKYLDGEDDSMEFVDSYWKSVANGADEKALQNSLKHAIHDRVSPGSKDADDAFKEAMANIKHYEKESQKHYKIKSNAEVKKAVDDEMGISDAHRELFGDDLEKAHQDGDMHPNGKWVWVSSANGGKGDWRTLNGRAHKKHSETQASNKFLENFKDASDDVLNKIVSGKIQAVDRERKLAQQILDSRKKSGTQSQPQSKNIGNLSYNYDKDTNETWYEGNINNKRVRVLQEEVGDNSWWNVEVDGKKLKNADGKRMTFSSAKEAANEGVIEAKKSTKGKKKQSSTTQNAHVQKLIDTYKISNNSYTDTSKMSIVITPKGNWNLRYDGKDVSTISGQRNIMDRKTLEAAGIKFEESKKRPVGAGTNGPTPKTKADKKVTVFTGNASNAIKSSGLFGSGYTNGKRSMGDIASINVGSPNTRNGSTPATVIYTTPTGAYKTVSVTIDAEGKVTKDSGWQSSQSFSSLDDAKSYIEYGKRGRNIFTKKWEDEPGQGSTTKNNQGKTGKDFNIVGARAKDVADNVASVLGGKVTGDENVKVSGIPGATIKAYKITVGNDSFFIHDGVYERSYSQKGYARYKGFTVMKSDGSRIMKYKVNAAGTHFTNAFSRNAGELGSYIKQTWGYGK